MTLSSPVNKEMKFATIVTSSNPATANLLDRIRRVSPIYKIANVESVREAYLYLDVPVTHRPAYKDPESSWLS